jgi:MFS family permease
MFTGALTGLVPHIGYVTALRVLDGLGSAALWPTAFAVISDVVEEKNRSTAMGILNVTYMGGIALGPLMGGMVNDYTGMHEASFYLVSLLFLMAFVLGVITFPKEAGQPHHVDLPEPEQHSFKLSDVLHSLKVVPDMLVLAFVTFLGIGLLMPIVKPYAMEQFGLTETAYGAALTPVAAALAVFAVPLGRIGDKYGKGRSVCWGIAGCAVAMWIIATDHNIVVVGVCAAVLGVGFVSAFPAWLALISERTIPSRRGEVLGAVGTAQGIGSIIGAALGSFLYFSRHLTVEGVGIKSINLPFYGCAILLTIAAIISFGWICTSRNCFAKPTVNNE